MATRAPSLASAPAIARPIPFDAPVTSATFPSMPEVHGRGRYTARAVSSRLAGEPRTPQREQHDRHDRAEPVHADQRPRGRRQPGEGPRRARDARARERSRPLPSTSAQTSTRPGRRASPSPRRTNGGSASASATERTATTAPARPRRARAPIGPCGHGRSPAARTRRRPGRGRHGCLLASPRARSSVARASPLQGEGRRFESGRAHGPGRRVRRTAGGTAWRACATVGRRPPPRGRPRRLFGPHPWAPRRVIDRRRVQCDDSDDHPGGVPAADGCGDCEHEPRRLAADHRGPAR